MRDTIDMAREVKMPYDFVTGEPIYLEKLKAFEALVRSDERNSWPLEMEAMERQVNILTDALAEARADERKHIAKFVEDVYVRQFKNPWREDLAAAIRARSNT